MGVEGAIDFEKGKMGRHLSRPVAGVGLLKVHFRTIDVGDHGLVREFVLTWNHLAVLQFRAKTSCATGWGGVR